VLAGASDARDLVVPVRFDLGRDGRLLSEPVVTGGSASPQFGLAAENVVRAIRQCEPYNLPPDLYDKWQHWEIDFDPRAMFGG
jgi:colicin import membrane protein